MRTLDKPTQRGVLFTPGLLSLVLVLQGTGLALMVLLLSGCPGVSIPPGPTGDVVSFSRQIQPIFDANCIICHVSGGIAGEILLLNAEESFDALLNLEEEKEEEHEMGMHGALVVPGDAEASYLFQKVSLDSPPEGGARMPLGGPPLSDEDIVLIRDWIDQGALNN